MSPTDKAEVKSWVNAVKFRFREGCDFRSREQRIVAAKKLRAHFREEVEVAKKIKEPRVLDLH